MEPQTQAGGGGGGKEPPKLPPTDQMFPGEDPNAPRPGESAEDYFNRTGYSPTEPTSPMSGTIDRAESGSYRSPQHQEEIAIWNAMSEQMTAETKGFAKEVATYLKTLVGEGIPFQAALMLAREWQQAEIARRGQLDMLDRRLEHE